MPILEPVYGGTEDAKTEKRIARAYMRKAACLLFVLVFLNSLSGIAFSYVLEKHILDVEMLIVKFVSLFGVPKTTAIIAVREFVVSGLPIIFFEMLMTLLTLAIPAFLFAKCVRLEAQKRFNIKGRCIKGIFFVFCFVQMITLAVSFVSNGMYDFLVPPSSGVYDGSFTAELPSLSRMLMDTVLTAVLVPLVEEYVFRGVLLSYLSRYSLGFGIIASAFLFGIAHSAPVQSVYAFVFGLIGAYTVVVTGNMKTAIVLHALNNFSMVLFGYLPMFLTETIASVIYGIYIVIVIAFSFVGLSGFVMGGGIEKVCFADSKQGRRPFGMAEIFVLPVIVFIILYALRFVLLVM